MGIKLALIVALILVGSIWAITGLMTLMVSSELVRAAENTNFTINNRAASGIEERLYKIRSDALLLLDMSSAMDENTNAGRQLRNIFFERNPNIAAVIVPGGSEIINQQFITNNEISPYVFRTWLETESETIELAKQNVPVLLSLAKDLDINLLALFYPWQSNGIEESAVVFFSPQNLSEITASGSNSTIVANGDGDVLVHPDFSQVQMGANISDSIYFGALKRNPGETVSISYSEGGNRIVATGHRISFADIAVFSTLEYSLITEQIDVISRRSIMLSITVLFLSFLVTWFFSRSLTIPVKKLTAAAGRIKTGDFYMDLKTKSRDEIGALTERFIEMGQGLSQWEEARDLVGRYNNREITDMAMMGEMNLEGEYIQAVILSVDLISFPDISVNMNAQDSLSFLNSFIAKIMNCIEKTGGVVDKIIGGRLIALWGVPSPSRNFTDEVMRSLDSALMMRNLISETNEDRKNSELPLIKMGCGIHVGQVIAGRIGAFQYNRYSVTGKNVKLAVNCGEACDQAEKDIIISQTLKDLAGSSIITEELSTPQIASSDVSMFALVNLTSSQDREDQKDSTPET